MPLVDPSLLLLLPLALCAALFLNLRVRLAISDQERRLRVVIAGTGADLDFIGGAGRLLLFGLPVGSFSLAGGAPKPPRKSGSGRERALVDLLEAAADSSIGVWAFVVGLLRATSIDELDGDVVAGFENPALTGQLFGYYSAVVGVAPWIERRLRCVPDWTGGGIRGSIRLAVAVPLADLCWLVLLLVVRLPWVQLVRIAIGNKKGTADVE